MISIFQLYVPRSCPEQIRIPVHRFTPERTLRPLDEFKHGFGAQYST